MLVTLVEVVEQRQQYTNSAERLKAYNLREVTVNPDHVVCLREDHQMLKMLSEGYLPEEMDNRQQFTRLYLDRGQAGIDITVVGSVQTVKASLGVSAGNREVLNG
tara:strand:+ start:148 stop:462 length:315 start_codon:yes stop_codon:yes gene_type:complete